MDPPPNPRSPKLSPITPPRSGSTADTDESNIHVEIVKAHEFNEISITDTHTIALSPSNDPRNPIPPFSPLPRLPSETALHSEAAHESLHSSFNNLYRTETEHFRRQSSVISIQNRFEHAHNPDKEEFKLIPHPEDEDYWKRYFPILYWLLHYKWRQWFILDFCASITSTVMVIPLSLGYSLIAGLPPVHGLYTGLMGHTLYGLFGTSGQAPFGPNAVVSLMTKETLHHFFPDDDDAHHTPDDDQKYVAYASCLAFQVGIISLCIGLARGGALANMLAEPVIVGFTTAAVVLIGLSQMRFVFQVEVHGEKMPLQLSSMIADIHNIHGWSVLLCAGCMAILLLLKAYRDSKSLPLAKYAKFIPSALIVVIIGTLISKGAGRSANFDIVDDLKDGVPKFVNFFKFIEVNDFWDMWLSSLLITVLSFMETVVITTKFADKHDYSIDASQELIALGICNIVGSWFQIYPISCIMSVAAVVESAGATTPLFSLMGGLFFTLSIQFFLSAFTWTPKPVLGAIVLVGIFTLLDLRKMKEIWEVNRRDFAVMSVTILCTLLLGIEYGVITGVLCSIMMFVHKQSKPHYAILGKIENTDPKVNIYRNVKHHRAAVMRDDMIIIRWDSSIFFANAESFKKRIRKHIGRFLAKNKYPSKWCLVLCFSGVNDIDYSGIDAVRAFFIELKEKERGMTLLICKMKEHLRELLSKSGILEIVGEDHILYELHKAEEWWTFKKDRGFVDSANFLYCD